jgi:hypothetical protein
MLAMKTMTALLKARDLPETLRLMIKSVKVLRQLTKPKDDMGLFA